MITEDERRQGIHDRLLSIKNLERMMAKGRMRDDAIARAERTIENLKRVVAKLRKAPYVKSG